MNRITLASMFVVAVAAAPVMAQDPTPPARPLYTPVAPIPAYEVDRIHEQAREIERMSRDGYYMVPPAIDARRLSAEATREMMANQREITAAAREASRAVMDNQREYADIAREAARAAMEVDRQFRE